MGGKKVGDLSSFSEDSIKNFSIADVSAQHEVQAVKEQAIWKSNTNGARPVADLDTHSLGGANKLEKAASTSHTVVVEKNGLEPKTSTRAPLPVKDNHSVAEIKEDNPSEMSILVEDFANSSSNSIFTKSKGAIEEERVPLTVRDGFQIDKLKTNIDNEQIADAVTAAIVKCSYQILSAEKKSVKIEELVEDISAFLNTIFDEENQRTTIFDHKTYFALTGEERNKHKENKTYGLLNIKNFELLTDQNSSFANQQQTRFVLAPGTTVEPEVFERLQHEPLKVLLADTESFDEIAEIAHEQIINYLEFLNQPSASDNTKVEVEKTETRPKVDSYEQIEKHLRKLEEQDVKRWNKITELHAEQWLQSMKDIFANLLARRDFKSSLSFHRMMIEQLEKVEEANEKRDSEKFEAAVEELKKVINREEVKFEIKQSEIKASE